MEDNIFTRVEFIDFDGREVPRWGRFRVSIQDEGRTLKIFRIKEEEKGEKLDLERRIWNFVASAGKDYPIVPSTVLNYFSDVAIADVRQAMRGLLQDGELVLNANAHLSVRSGREHNV